MLFTSLPLNVFADTPIAETGTIVSENILADENESVTEQKTDEGIQENTVDNPVVDIDTSQPSVLPTENDLLTDNSTTELSPEMLEILENITVDNDEDVIETIPVEKEEQENDAITEERPQREANGPSKDEILAIQMMEEELRELNSGIQENSMSYSMVEEQPVALFSMSRPNAALADSESVEKTDVDDEVIAEEETEVIETIESTITTESVTEDTSSDDESITEETSIESDESDNQESSNVTTVDENSIENTEALNSVETDSSVSSGDELGSEAETTDEGDNTTLEDIVGVENDVLEEELIEESIQLFSNTYTGINGTIRLPEGVSASSGDMIRVYVYDAPIVVDGKVVKEGGSNSILYTTINLSAGQTSGTFSIDNLPDGNYEISVRYLTGNRYISGAMLYYSEYGLTENEYLSSVITVEDGCTNSYLDMTFPTADLFISGTIDLSNCIPETDTYIAISTNNESYINDTYQYTYVYVEAGEQYAEFEFGAKQSSYYLYFSSDLFDSGYYSNNTLDIYGNRTVITVDNSISGLNVRIPEAPTSEETTYNVAINFSENLDTERQYYVMICDAAGDSVSSKWITVPQGANTLETVFTPSDVGDVAYLAFIDITGFDSVYSEIGNTTYFYSEELGITNNILYATNIVGQTEIVIDEPICVEVKGDILTTGNSGSNTEYVYVAAEFDNEIYYTRALVEEGFYSIRVPEYLSGKEFSVFVARGRYGEIIDSTRIYNDETYILTGEIMEIAVDAGEYKSITGTISLPYAAPEDGINISLSYDINNDAIKLNNYVIYPGENSVDYSVSVLNVSEDTVVDASISSYENVNISRYASSGIDDNNIAFSETYNISGVVSLPENVVLDKDLTIRVYASCSSGSGSVYRTIFAGENSVAYDLAVEQNTTLRYLYVDIETENSGLFEQVYYVSDDESSTEYIRVNLPVNSNLEANIELIDADLIEGSVRLPDTAEYNGAEIEYQVYCQGVNSGEQYSSNYWQTTYTPYDDNYFSVPVPVDSTEDYYVYVRVDENGGNKIHSSSYYYVSNDEMTLDYEDATPVSVGGNYRLQFPLGEYIEGTISFEEGSYIDGSLDITLYIRDMETRDTHYVYLRDIYNTNNYSYKIVAPLANEGVTVSAYVYADGDTNIAVEERFYYSVNGTTPDSNNATIVDMTSGASGIDITIPKGRTITGQIIIPDDYKSLNDLQEVEIYMDADSGSSYWLNATVDENMNYEAPIPAEASGEYTLRMSFYDSYHNNIVRKEYYYDDENDNVISLNIEGTTSISNIDFELETGHAISGTVSLPENIQINNAEISVEISDENGYGCVVSDLSLEHLSGQYMFAIPKDIEETSISFTPWNNRVEYNQEYSSNIYIGSQYYVQGASLSVDSNEATKLAIASDIGNIDVELLTGIVFDITMVRPEVETNYISGYVYVTDEDETINLSQRFTISSGDAEGKVTLTVPNSYVGKEVYISYYTYSGNYLYNGTVYVNPDGTYSRTLEKAQTHTVVNTNKHRITLAKVEDVQEVVRFKVNFEDGSFTNDELYCQAYAYNVNTGRNYYTYCYFDEIQELEVMIPVNEEDGDYRISAYISNYSDASTNVSEDKRYYYSTSGTTSSESEATTIKSTDTNISITIPKLEVITVNVGFEEGCFLTDDLYCNVQAYDINNYRSYYKSFYFDEIKDYEVVIPVQDKDSQYRVHVYINDYSDEPTNVSTGAYYYYSTDGTTTEEYSATPVYVTDENISITIPKLRSISGSIVVDDDYQCLDELTEVSAYLSRISGSGRSYYYTTARVDEDMNYQFFIPEDIIGDYKIGLEFEPDFRNNIIKNEYFYYTNSSGSIQSVSITDNSDITDIDIKAQTGYAVTGTIKLPNDFVAGGDYDSVQYYISLYNGMYVTLSEEEPEAEFMFAVPKSGGTYRLSANANNYFGNLYTGEVYYKTSTDVAYDYSDATSIPVNSNLSGLVLTIPTGIKFDINVELPETYYNSLEMCFRVKSDDGEFENSNTIYAYNDEDNYCGFVLPNYMLGEKVYLTYEIDDYYNELSDTFYTALVYVNSDGTYTGAKKLAKLIQLGETNEFVVTPVSSEDVLMPEYVLESEHPYANEIDETYEYVHPETVDYLAVTFSEETYTEYNDRIYLYDENDNQLGSYYEYEELSGKTINIPGSSFKIRLVTNYSSTAFGFAIESVVGSTFVLESSHPYESNMDTYYYYTYPESVEELDITFSDNTEFDDYNDYLYIYEGDSDYYNNSYSSDSLKGRTIRIYGNSFKLRLVSDSSDERYGFSITSIKPVVYYTVTFKNYNGNILATQKVEAGDDAYYYGSDPRKEMDENYMYVFKGWDADLSNISSDITVTAQFEAKTYHTVTFNNYDGSLLDTQYVATGATAYYNGYTPTKPSEGTISYRFIGWDVELSNVTSDLIATAQFEELVIYLESEHPYANSMDKTYTYTHPEPADELKITFSADTYTESGYDYIYILDENGSQIGGSYTGSQLANATITVPGNKFSIRLTSDGSATKYGFAIINVEATQVQRHTVTFKNYDGTILETQSVIAGNSVEYSGETPTRPKEGTTSYTFTGWDIDLSYITEDVVATAVYSSKTVYLESSHPYENGIDETYTYTHPEETEGLRITFSPETVTEGGWDEIYLYDGLNELVGTYSGSALSGKSFTIEGNSFKIRLTTDGSVSYYGFEVTNVEPVAINKYTVTFKNYDGTVLQMKTVIGGNEVTYSGREPYKETDDEYMYFFSGWDKNLTNITEDTIVTAQFESSIYHIVTFKNYDGTVLSETKVADGGYAYFDYNNYPTKERDENYMYEFSGWDIDLSNVTEDLVATAQFTAMEYHVVTYKNYDGTILYSDYVPNGYDSEFIGELPYRPYADGKGYIFDGWDCNTWQVQEDIIATAVFTECDVITITTEEELRNIANNPYGVFVLGNDIELTSQWTPIGSYDSPFRGVLDGSNYKISNVMITELNQDTYGFSFFETVESSMIQNLNIEIVIGGENWSNIDASIAGFANEVYGSRIHNVHVEGVLYSNTEYYSSVSGFASNISYSTVSNSSATVDITSSGSAIGFAQRVQESTISDSYYSGNLTLTSLDGEIYGFAQEVYKDSPRFENCYSNAVSNIPEGEFTGESAPFVNKYVEWGYNYTVNNSYYNEDKYTLGALGYMDKYSQIREEVIAQGIGLSDSEMKSPNSFVGFDFTNVWGVNDNVNNGYPYIRNSNNNYCDTHTYGEWIIISNASCDVAGLKRRVCSVCGTVERESIAALGHDYSEEWIIDVEATCSTTGSKSHHCSRCSSVSEVTVIEALGHILDEWIVRTQPNCTENGEKYRECTRENCNYEEVDIIEKLGHDYVAEWIVDVEPTCTTTGSKSYHCSRCSGKTNDTIIVALGHNYTDWMVRISATCTTEGEEYRECIRENCTHEETNVIAALGHDYSEEWTVDIEATCTTTGSKSHHCSRCSSKTDVTIIDALGHNYTEWTERVSPTCTTDGEEYRECTRTNCYHEETNVLVALGHDFSTEWTTDIEPTCTTEGSKSHHCSRCTEKSDVTVIEAHGHNYGDWTTRIAATCTTDGEEYRVCTRCPSEETNVLPALGHDFAEEWTVDVEPTCTTEGSKSHHCSRCSEKSDVTAIDALGHDYDEWQTRTEATCTTDGLEFHTCQRTGCGHEETNVLPMLGHDFAEEWTVDVEPTCTTEGSKSHHCSRCSEKSDVTVIEANGHTFGDWITEREPSVLAEGLKTRECSICHTKEEEITDKLFVDPNNQNYGIATFTVVDAQSLTPIENAQIFITTENDGENTFNTDAEGRVTQILPVGKLNVSVYGEDYLARNLKVNIKPGEQIVPNIGLSTRPMVKGELTHELMTMDEMIEAGIDINAPGNKHVYKYSIELDFHAGIDVVSILAYFNGFGDFIGFGGGFGGGNGGGSGSGSSGTGEPTYNLHYHVDDGWHGHGWCKTQKTELGAYEVLTYIPFRDNDDYVFDGWYTDTTYTQRIYNVTVDEYTEMVYGRWIYVGEGEESKSKPFWKTTLSDETPVTIYPVSEKFYMIIYGEVKWLKEMFDVELLVMNDSATDTVENGVAELNLPDGLSLATMRSDVGQQTTVKEIPFIDKMSSESVHWYVRGDKEGSYDLSATFKGMMMPFEEEFTYEFGTERPLQVYAGSAMHMDITVPDSTFYGDDYVIEIALTNVSDRTLYGVRHAITGFEQAKVTEYSDGTVKKTTYVDKGYMGSIGADEFHPGDKMVIEITTNVMFESEVMEYQLGKLTGAIDDIEKLMEAYKAFKKGADLLTSTHSFFKSVSKNIDSVVKDAFIDDIDKAKAAADLLNAVEKFTGSIEKGSSGKALKMVNKVRGTDTYKDLYSVAYDADFYNTHSAGTIANIASNLMAIYNSAENESVEEEFNAYETIKSLIEAIPIRFYLDNVIVTTLEGSTTEIPYSIHKTPVGARYFGVDNVGKLLWNSGVALMGEVDVPWPLKLLGLDDPTGSKEAEKYVQTVLNETKKFAAKDATGDTSFRAWIIPANQTVSLMSNDAQLFSTQGELFELSSTNENAIYENGVLSFTGPGYINVKPLSSNGGTLYVQMNEDTIQEFVLGVVEQHTCGSDKWVALIEPDDETEGTRVKYCDTCNDVIAIESFKICEHHIYGSYVVEVEATETTAGLKSRICTECGHIQYTIINSANDETSLKLNDDSSLEIDEDSGYLINTPEKITVEQLKSNFENQDIIIRNANGDVLSDTSSVGTGYVVQLVVDDEVIDETTVVVKGDISGDGKINVLDMVQLFNFVQGTSTLEGAYKEAAYISNDATINVLDLVTLFNVVQN